MQVKSMDVLQAKLSRHPRREIEGRSWNGTPCLELMALGGARPVMLNRDGYARVGDGQGGKVLVHRAALAVATGRDVWTEPLVTDHQCFTRNCCNPLHLEWTTNVENASTERTSPEGLAVKRATRRANGRAHADATRIAVVSRHLDTGEVRWHRDQHAAARELGRYQGGISECVQGKRLRVGRFTFERYDPEDPVHVALHAEALGESSRLGDTP